MHNTWFHRLACIALLFLGSTSVYAQTKPVSDGLTVDPNDWPWWRGPMRNGTADSNQAPPLEFGRDKNVRWKVSIPGRGYGSPSIARGKVYLATSDEKSGSQSLLCVDRKNGAVLWTTTVHEKGGMRKNNKSTSASSSPAIDDQHAYICFPNSDQLFVTALTLDGRIAWQKSVTPYVEHQGYGASPSLYQDLVLVSADNKGGGAIAAYKRKTGELVWKRERPKFPNYTSPIILNTSGKDQLVMIGCDQVVSYDPLTGTTLWETAGATTECVTSTVTDGKLIYTSGGYPTNHMSAISTDGSAKLVWKNNNRLYVPSPLIKDGYLYAVLDAGIAMCWKADTGEEQWKARLGGDVSSSPILVGDKIYAASESGDVFVFRAQPSKFEKLAENKLGDLSMASPVICGGEIFHRVSFKGEDGQMNEVLYCLANSAKP